MAIDGKKGSVSYDDERAQAGDPIILLVGKVKASQGELPVGLIVNKDSNGDMIPYEEVADEVLGSGDGSTKAFSGTLAKKPVEPGSVVVSDGVETFSDDGLGRLVGDAGGTGSIYYDTGAISVSFNANVGNGVDVEVDYVTKIDGVLDELVDTTKATSANYVDWGLVRKDVLKVGATAKAAPSTTLLGRLKKKGIYAV